MSELTELNLALVAPRLLLAMVVGGVIGYERRMHQKAIGIAGMVMVATGSTAYMLLSRQLAINDPGALGRTVQGILQGIGFLGGAVIFKGGTDVRGIKTAAAVWITGAIGLAIGTEAWWLGVLVGAITAVTLLVADMTDTGPRQGRSPEESAARAEEASKSE